MNWITDLFLSTKLALLRRRSQSLEWKLIRHEREVQRLLEECKVIEDAIARRLQAGGFGAPR